MKKFTIGSIFSLIAAILSLVACGIYTQVMYTVSVTYILLIAAVLVTVIALFVKVFPAEILPVCNALLIASAAVWGARNMVNQIGYVIAGLDTMDTIQSFVIFEVIAIIAIVINIIAGFLPQRKAEAEAKVVSE